MLADHYRAAARYNGWMNERLYHAAATLSDEERRRDLGAFFRSIHGTLNHLVLADCAWMARFTADPAGWLPRAADGSLIRIVGLDQELYADFDELTTVRRGLDRRIESWAATLDDDDLARPLAYGSMSGGSFEHATWWAVSHFFNHQTHHRGQVTALLTQLGRDPGVTDMVVMLRSEQPG